MEQTSLLSICILLFLVHGLSCHDATRTGIDMRANSGVFTERLEAWEWAVMGIQHAADT